MNTEPAHSPVDDSARSMRGRANASRMNSNGEPRWTRSGIDFRSFYGDNIGDFAVHFGRLEGALQVGKHEQDARLVLGYIYFFSDRYDDALTQFDSLLTSSPGDATYDHYRRHCLVEIDKAGGLEEH